MGKTPRKSKSDHSVPIETRLISSRFDSKAMAKPPQKHSAKVSVTAN